MRLTTTLPCLATLFIAAPAAAELSDLELMTIASELGTIIRSARQELG